METQVIMNAFHHVTWGEGIAIYFFLLGISIGVCVVSTFGWVFGIARYKQVGLLSSIFAIIVLLIIPPFLIADLGKPFRFFYLFMPGYWHATSPMSWGGAFLTFYMTFMAIYAWFIYKNNPKWAKVFGLLTLIFAISLRWYTSVVMQLNPARGLNHTALAPLVFFASAFISGTAVLAIIFWLKNLLKLGDRIDDSVIIELGRIMVYGMTFEIFFAFSEYMQMVYGTEEEFVNLKYILLGVMKTNYFLVGLVVSFVIMTFTPIRKTVGGVVFASILVLIAVWGIIHSWVYGGQYLQTFF
ncbi:MAG TPA: hypothetical protein DD641_05195 [Deltaproteobacteria bacterium]|nr:hypothetical protein [Deltaproteobacteria bacterium]